MVSTEEYENKSLATTFAELGLQNSPKGDIPDTSQRSSAYTFTSMQQAGQEATDESNVNPAHPTKVQGRVFVVQNDGSEPTPPPHMMRKREGGYTSSVPAPVYSELVNLFTLWPQPMGPMRSPQPVPNYFYYVDAGCMLINSHVEYHRELPSRTITTSAVQPSLYIPDSMIAHNDMLPTYDPNIVPTFIGHAVSRESVYNQ